MTLYAVEGVSTQGNETVIFVPTLTTPTAPKLTEVGAGVVTALNLGYALRGFSPSSDQGSSDDIRLASTQTYENPGRVKTSLDDITYVYDPQAAVSTASNKHFEVLKSGVKGFLIDRRGIPATTPPAVGDKVDIYPVQFGAQRRVAVDPSAEGGKFEIVQKPFVIGNVLENISLVA
jgi:hypothetical protein